MKTKNQAVILKSFSRRSQRATLLRTEMKRLVPMKGASSTPSSSVSKVVHDTFYQHLITNHRLQEILDHHRSIQGLLPRFSSHVNPQTTQLSISNGASMLKSSAVLTENVDSTQQHTNLWDPEDLDDDDTDWLSIPSDEQHNVEKLPYDSTEIESDQKFFNYKSDQSSSSDSNTDHEYEEEEQEEEKASWSHSRTHSTLEIAVLLSLFRHRHSLSKSCITDICHLLRLLGIQNVPADYRSIYKLLNPLGNLLFAPKVAIVCPTCCKVGMNMEKCSVQSCSSHAAYVRKPTINYTFELRGQIKSILERVPLIDTGKSDGRMSDVVDGIAHARIRASEKKPFISLTLNSDGVLVQKISRSLWITTLVINEIPRSIRFKLSNMVIGMISYGSQKPKRAEFSSLLNILVDELVELESGIDVCLPSSTDTCFLRTNVITRMSVFLLGIVSDKPAQSLIQNMTDSGGFFGCGKCQVSGESVRAGKGHIRCFPIDLANPPALRTNKTYDQAMKILKKNNQQCTRRNSLTRAKNDDAKGHIGPSVLRKLRFFDMGFSFLTDSLHNLYAGAFLRLLKIWLELPSSRKNTTYKMSIFNQRKEVEIAFDSIQFPTSSYRIPRYLKHFNQYKANELRLCLLMGYNCFQFALNKNQYNHLKALAFALHLAESRNIDDEIIQKIDELLKYFNQEFKYLYTKRHIVSVVPSVVHVASSVREYGPIMNYSTFNFESLIGALVRTIRDPSQPSTELCYNLELLHHSWLEFDKKTFLPSFKLFINQINSSSKQDRLHSTNKCSSSNIRFYRRIRSLSIIDPYIKNRQYELYSTIFYNGLRFAYKELSTTSRTHDGCILYYDSEDKTKLRIGFIQCTVKLLDIKQNNVFLFVEQVKITSVADTLNIKDQQYECTNVLQGYLCQSRRFVLVKPQQIKEKIAFRVQEISTRNKFFFTDIQIFQRVELVIHIFYRLIKRDFNN